MTYLPGDSSTRPWGSWEVLATGHGYVVKRLHIQPFQAISLQRHEHRTEHWHVVLGSGTVRLGEAPTFLVRSGHSVFVQRGQVHQITALSETLVLIEVQRGSILSEDDIERFP